MHISVRTTEETPCHIIFEVEDYSHLPLETIETLEAAVSEAITQALGQGQAEITMPLVRLPPKLGR